jgi:hypothetical protein
MTDRERQLESEVAWLRYGPERMELALRERNTVWIDRAVEEYGGDPEYPTTSESGDDDEDKPEEFEHVIVCGCKQCMASHRFGAAEPDNIFSSFDDEERECIVKKCLKYHCEKAELVVVEQKWGANLKACHVALVEDPEGESWHVVYGGLLTDPPLFHEAAGFAGLVTVFDTMGAGAKWKLLDISKTTDKVRGFFTDGSGTDYIAQAKKRDFCIRGGGDGETGAEYKARRTREEKEKEDASGNESE